jgi:amino acid transporter
VAISAKTAVTIDPAHHGLKQYEMKTSTVVFMIFCLCAAGAYGIEEMIPQAGPGLTLVMLIVLPFLWSTPMGLVAAELGSAFPQEGGYYKWVQRACGEFWGFQAAWWRTISVYFDNTLYVVLAGSYLASVLDLSALQEYLFKASVIIVFTYINIRGIRDVGAVSSIISIFVLAAFGLVAAVGFATWQTNPFDPFIPPGQSLLQSIGYGLAIGMWVYSGYESMSTVAGEIKDPQVIPRATMLTVPLIMAVYILPTMGGLASLGRWSEWASEGGLTYGDVVTQIAPSLGVFFVFIAVIAQFSIFNTYIASGSRGFFALAEDNLAPRILVKCSALIFISACILRVKEGHFPRPFRVPVGTKVFIAMCVPSLIIIFVAFFINGTDYFVGGMAALVTGPIAYFIFKKRYGGLARIDPANYPVNPRTGLGVGDTKRMAWMFAAMTLVGGIAAFFLPWYDDPEYYVETYGIEGLFGFMIGCIRWITVASGALTVLLVIIASRVEPKDA